MSLYHNSIPSINANCFRAEGPVYASPGLRPFRTSPRVRIKILNCALKGQYIKNQFQSLFMLPIQGGVTLSGLYPGLAYVRLSVRRQRLVLFTQGVTLSGIYPGLAYVRLLVRRLVLYCKPKIYTRKRFRVLRTTKGFGKVF